MKKFGIKGKMRDFVQKMEGMKRDFEQMKRDNKMSIDIIKTFHKGISTEDPGEKTKVFFDILKHATDAGSTLLKGVPLAGLVAQIAESYIDLANETLAAGYRAMGKIDANFNQGCMTTLNKFNSSAMGKAFRANFPNIDRACPMSLSKHGGPLRNIYFDEAKSSTLLFYINKKWEMIPSDGTHKGPADINALRYWLKKNGHSQHADNIHFLRDAYAQSGGFIYYNQEVKNRIDKIFELGQIVFGTIGNYCEKKLVEDYLKNDCGLYWMEDLMKESGFQAPDIQNSYWKEDVINQMIENRYVTKEGHRRTHKGNLVRLDDIIEKFSYNIPIRVSGKIFYEERKQGLGGAVINCRQPHLFKNNKCSQNISKDNGRFEFFVKLPLAYTGDVEFICNYEGMEIVDQQKVNAADSRTVQINFHFKKKDDNGVKDLVISQVK